MIHVFCVMLLPLGLVERNNNFSAHARVHRIARYHSALVAADTGGLAGKDLDCRETSESPRCCATRVTIIEFRMKVPLLMESPTTYTARPRRRKTRDASPSACPISHAYLAKRA